MGAFNTERAAVILVEAAYKGDGPTAEAWGVTKQTLRNYRKRLETDQELYSLFARKKALAEKDWADEAPLAIRAAIAFIQRAAVAGEITPEMVHAVAGAMKLTADMVLTKQVLDARLTGADRPQNGRYREMAAGGTTAN